MPTQQVPAGLTGIFNNLWQQEEILRKELINIARNYTSSEQINRHLKSEGKEFTSELGTRPTGARLAEQLGKIRDFQKKLDDTNDPDVRFFAKDGFSTLTAVFDALNKIDADGIDNDKKILDALKPVVAPKDPSWTFFG